MVVPVSVVKRNLKNFSDRKIETEGGVEQELRPLRILAWGREPGNRVPSSLENRGSFSELSMGVACWKVGKNCRGSCQLSVSDVPEREMTLHT